MNTNDLFRDMALTSIIVSVIYSFFGGIFHHFLAVHSAIPDHSSGITVILTFFGITLITIFIIAPVHYYLSRFGTWKGPTILFSVTTILIIVISGSTGYSTLLFYIFLPLVFSVFSLLLKYFLNPSNNSQRI